MVRDNTNEVLHCIGTIVQSTAGRDKKRCFVIVGLQQSDKTGMVYIADGRLRKIESPKLKSLRHLKIIKCADQSTANVIFQGSMTNRNLRELLWDYNNKP